MAQQHCNHCFVWRRVEGGHVIGCAHCYYRFNDDFVWDDVDGLDGERAAKSRAAHEALCPRNQMHGPPVNKLERALRAHGLA